MIIRMKRFYLGPVTSHLRLERGQEYDSKNHAELNEANCAELIERGFAEDITPKRSTKKTKATE